MLVTYFFNDKMGTEYTSLTDNFKDFFFFLKVIEYVVPRFSDFQRMDQGAVAYPIKRQFHLIIYVFFYCNTLVWIIRNSFPNKRGQKYMFFFVFSNTYWFLKGKSRKHSKIQQNTTETKLKPSCCFSDRYDNSLQMDRQIYQSKR